jgi:mannonate dehydratase
MKDNRREFIKKGSALAALSLVGLNTNKADLFGVGEPKQIGSKESKISSQGKPIMKIAYQASPEPTEDNIKFIQQMGIDQVVLWTDSKKASADYYASRKQLYAAAGINVFGFGDFDVHNQDAIVLNLPGRDDKIEEYKNHLRNLNKAGIRYTTYAHMANGIWSTKGGKTRGDSSARSFDLANATGGSWIEKRYEGPLTHGRKYTTEEIWKNYEYFIKAVAPVAETENVRIGIHPDDPPVAELGGIPRCIFSSFEGYRQALEIADSPNVGMCLCVGCWLEGGSLMGKDVIETIEYFGKRKKIFKVHLRNVDQPLPHFTETFLDNGYASMYKIMKALKKVDFDGVIIADHIPSMVGSQSGSAFSVGYLKGLLEGAVTEG